MRKSKVKRPIGRPPRRNVRMDDSIEIRCTEEEREALRSRCKRLGMTLADYLRSCIRELSE